MDLSLEAARRELIIARAKERDPIKRERMSIVIYNLSVAIADPEDQAVRRALAANVRDMAA